MNTQKNENFSPFTDNLAELIKEKRAQRIAFIQKSEYTSLDKFIMAYNNYIEKLRASQHYSTIIAIDTATGQIPASTILGDVVIYVVPKEKTLAPSNSDTPSRENDDDSSR